MPLHTIPPEIHRDSRILILGSFPSVKSREYGFYYAHPQNRFWPLLGRLFGRDLMTIEDKKLFLEEEHIALSDVILSCSIEGSSDSSITEVVPNDIATLIRGTEVSHVFLNGGKAAELFRKHNALPSSLGVTKLPSTSPANASWSFERLLGAWSVVRDALGQA